MSVLRFLTTDKFRKHFKRTDVGSLSSKHSASDSLLSFFVTCRRSLGARCTRMQCYFFQKANGPEFISFDCKRRKLDYRASTGAIRLVCFPLLIVLSGVNSCLFGAALGHVFDAACFCFLFLLESHMLPGSGFV